MDKKSNKRIKIVNENCKINKTNQSISSSKVMKNYEILPFQNKIIKFNIQLPMLSDLNGKKNVNFLSNTKVLLVKNSPQRKSDSKNNKEFEKIFSDIIRKKDDNDKPIKRENKKSADLTSRNRNKLLETFDETSSKTSLMVNNINYRNISFINNDIKGLIYNSPSINKVNDIPNPVMSKLKHYKKQTVGKTVNNSLFSEMLSMTSNKVTEKKSKSELKRINYPLKVKVDLNVMSREIKSVKDFKKRIKGRPKTNELSHSFYEKKIKSSIKNKKTSINSLCKSYDNAKCLNNFISNESIDNGEKLISPFKVELNKNSPNCLSNFNCSLNFTQNLNKLNDNVTTESEVEILKKSSKDENWKKEQKNEIESVEEIHYLFINFLKQSKNMERINEISVKSISSKNTLDFLQANIEY